jgi:hypothetical protein
MLAAKRAWLLHMVGGLVASGAVYGLIDAFAPAGHRAEAYALIPVIAYLAGVAAPTPVKQ